VTSQRAQAQRNWKSRSTYRAHTRYDGIGNLLTNGNVGFSHSSSSPNQIQSSPAIPSFYTYDANGALAQRPDLDGGGADAARSITYDAEGRVSEITLANGRKVRSVYNYGGERVARIVDEGGASQQVSFYFGRAVEVTGGTLVRHVYLGGKLIAESPVPAPVNLMLASASAREHTVQLARVLGNLARDPSAIFAGFVMSREQAAKSTACIVLLLLILGATPGRVAVAFVSRRHSTLKRLRRGHVLVVIVVFATTLTPFTCARVADAGTPNGSNPQYPVYFVSADHLGSTLMLTCFKQGSACADRSIARHYRYDAFGRPSAYDGSGAPVDLGAPLMNGFVAEKLYTGQRWDDAAQTYDYGARMYDPRLARFLTHDPVREYMNPYAYVRWNPVRFTDPTGMFIQGNFDRYLLYSPFAAEWYAGMSGGKAQGGFGTSANGGTGGGANSGNQSDGGGDAPNSSLGVLMGRGDAASVAGSLSSPNDKPKPNDGPILVGGTYPEVVITASPLGTLAQAVLVGVGAAVLVVGGIFMATKYLASRSGALAGGTIGAVIGGFVSAIRGGSIAEGAAVGFVQGAAMAAFVTKMATVPQQAAVSALISGTASALSQYNSSGTIDPGLVGFEAGTAAVAALHGGAAGLALGDLAGEVVGGAYSVGFGVLARSGGV